MYTDTPETDAVVFSPHVYWPDFARRLELERNEARARLMNIEVSEIGPRVETIKQLDQAIAELNQRLIERQESFQAQLIRIEDVWREKLREARQDADRLYNCLRDVNNMDCSEVEALEQHESLTAKLLH